MYCKHCGKQVANGAAFCTHCGMKLSEQSYYASGSSGSAGRSSGSANTLAIVGFVLSFFVSVAGLICSIIAFKQIRDSGEEGRGFALAGIIISSVELGITVLGCLLALAIYSSVFIALFGVL